MLVKTLQSEENIYRFPNPMPRLPGKYSSIDLFSGAGGLSKGMEMGGFNSLAAVEYENRAAETFAYNFPDAKVYSDDIRNLDPRKLLTATGLKAGELDLLAGGPPCQGYSVNAPIRCLDDPRNKLFKEFLRFAEVMQPKTILIENVPGIVSLGGGAVVTEIYEHLAELGYIVHHRILYAGHYGVPQTRFRTIFLASRRGTNHISHPRPTHNSIARANFGGAKKLCFHLSPLLDTDLANEITVADAISDLPIIHQDQRDDELPYESDQSDYQKFSRRASNCIKNHHCAKIGASNIKRIAYIPQGGSWRDIPFDLLPEGMKRARRSDHTKRYGRLSQDGLASTILTKCDPHWGSFFHPTQDRIISVREAARLQSFPDNFYFLGGITEQYRQVGNAVPPLLAHAVAESIADHLEAEYG